MNTKDLEFLLGLAEILDGHNEYTGDDYRVYNALERIFNDRWITVHPNGEDEKGRHLLLKGNETPKEAMKRQWGVDVDKKKNKQDKETKSKKSEDYKQRIKKQQDIIDKSMKSYHDISDELNKYEDKLRGLIGDNTDNDKINEIIEQFKKDHPEVVELSKKRNEAYEDFSKTEQDFEKLTEEISDEVLKTDIENLSKEDLEDLKNAIEFTNGFRLGYEKQEKVQKLLRNVTDKINSLDYQVNKKEITEIAGVKKGKPMTHEEADNGKVNPNYKHNTSTLSYSDNCQSCVVCYQMRKKGFNVQTKGIPVDKKGKIIRSGKMFELARKPEKAWINPNTGKTPDKNICKTTTPTKAYKWLDDNIKEGETYSFRVVWKDKSHGHIVVAYKENNTLTVYDPQTNEEYWSKEAITSKFFDDCCLRTKDDAYKPFLFRTDNLDLNPDFADAIMESP